jgi:spore coat protein CotF
MLLQDQLSHEQICITKYSGYAARTRDPELRRMFHEFAADEQRHYDTINNLLQGSSQGQGQSQAGTRQQSGAQARRGQQAGSQGAGWQATQSGITGSMVETGGQAGSTLGQTGSYRATPGGQGQNWMSETRTVYGGQISQGTGSGGVQGGQATRQSQGTQGTGMTQSSQQASPSQQTQSGRSPMNFESASELSMSTSDDKSMLEDMLMTEKYISGAYDTAVFETSNQQVRQALQHIQQDEQRHGEEIFKYMQQKGMYQPQ